jgi:SAM-dependent MidA family methyltransferase
VIAQEIGEAGAISFRRFMELALYHPELGYYSRCVPGPDGDYVTSPELHGAFGALICVQFEQMWQILGRPNPFWLIEAGPGTGRFARDVLETAEAAFPEFASALQVALIERSPLLRKVQEELFAHWQNRVRWLDTDPQPLVLGPPPSPLGRPSLAPRWGGLGRGSESTVSGCVFANEVLDAFPVHRVVMRAGGLQETWVDVEDDRFVEIEKPASVDLANHIETSSGPLPLGCFAEINLDGDPWMQAVAGLIDRGYVLLIDYGAEADVLYSGVHPRGTLRAYQGQVLMDDPLALPGWRDLTAHADLSALRRSASEVGLASGRSTTQAGFLSQLGIDRLLDRVDDCVSERVGQRAHRAVLKSLVAPSGLGALAVLAFAKHAPLNDLVGFGGASSPQPPEARFIWNLRVDPARLGSIRRELV